MNAPDHVPQPKTPVTPPPHRFASRFDRSSWITLAIALVILVYILFPVFFTYTIPSDGWSIDAPFRDGDMADASLYLKTRLVDGPTPLRQNDVLQAVDARSVSDLISRWATYHPARPSNWISGQTIRYSILRGGVPLEVDVPLTRLPAHAFFRHIMEAWDSMWLSVFMYAFFLPAMVGIGVIVFFLRPRHLAAQALLVISISFVGQVSYAPFGTGSLFYWPLSIPYGFVFQRWTSIIIPTALLLSLAFPRPKGWLRRHPRLSLALIYLPWLVGAWAIVIIKSGDLAGLYGTWIQLGLMQMVLVLTMAGALIHSFRTVRGAIERAQLKWFTFGLSGFVLAGGISWGIGSIFHLPAFNTLVNYFGYLFLPLCLGIAILRYRLFDIDPIIRRTLVYTFLTVALGLVFYSGVTLGQWLFTSFSGQQSPASIVVSTLVIVVLFNPLRRQVQSFIDRRFYRQKYDAARTLEAFSTAVRNEVNLATLSDQLEKVVDETVRPEVVSLWLRKDKR